MANTVKEQRLAKTVVLTLYTSLQIVLLLWRTKHISDPFTSLYFEFELCADALYNASSKNYFFTNPIVFAWLLHENSVELQVFLPNSLAEWQELEVSYILQIEADGKLKLHIQSNFFRPWLIKKCLSSQLYLCSDIILIHPCLISSYDACEPFWIFVDFTK